MLGLLRRHYSVHVQRSDGGCRAGTDYEAQAELPYSALNYANTLRTWYQLTRAVPLDVALS